MEKFKPFFVWPGTRLRIPFWLLAILYALLFLSTARAGVHQMAITDLYADSGQTVVRWVVEEDNMAMYYVLEKSRDGRDYTEVHRQPGLLPADGSTPVHYQGADGSTEPGLCYYRIKRVDPDGRHYYSEIVPFRCTGVWDKEVIQVYPNPFTDHFSIRIGCLRKEEIAVSVVAVDGTVLLQFDSQCEKGENLVPVTIPQRLYGRCCFIRIISKRTGEVYCCKAFGL